MNRKLLLGYTFFVLIFLEGCCCSVHRQARIMARYGVITPASSCCGSEAIVVRPSPTVVVSEPCCRP